MTKWRINQRRPDPTPEEIRRRCLEVQATWSPSQRQRRRVDYDRLPWTVPEIDYFGPEWKDGPMVLLPFGRNGGYPE